MMIFIDHGDRNCSTSIEQIPPDIPEISSKLTNHIGIKLLHVHRVIHNSIEWNWLRALESFSCAAFRKLSSDSPI